MEKKELVTLKINPEFRKLELPYDTKTREKYEKIIQEKGWDKPLLVWSGVLLKDFDIYEICHKYQIPFYIKKVGYPNKLIAISEMCKLQHQHPALNETIKKYIIGKRFLVEKELGKKQENKIYKSRPSYVPKYVYQSTIMSLRHALSEEYHISHQTVYKYSVFTNALDIIASQSMEVFLKIIKEQVKISIDAVECIGNLPVISRDIAINRLQSRDVDYFAKNESKVTQAGIEKYIKKLQKNNSVPVSLKETPKFDPDSELKSLIFTVPSWTGSIMRARRFTNIAAVSKETKLKVRKELLVLVNTITELLYELEENRK